MDKGLLQALPLASWPEKLALEEVGRAARGHPSIARIVAFGSRVRGDFSSESDLDLLVILDDISAREDVVRFIFRIERKHDVSLSPVIYTIDEYAMNRKLGSGFVANIEREGVVIYDSQPR
jgi:predicted nucleotidyltransferase